MTTYYDKLPPYITGTAINYYFVCKKKLWYFLHDISMEQNSGLVSMGKSLHEDSYKRNVKELQLDGIKIDFITKSTGVIHEVKKSKAIKESAHWQMKYYLLYFKKLDLDFRGEINYPLLRRVEQISLNEDDIIELENIILEIQEMKNTDDIPSNIDNKICKKCSYYDLCYI